jgi:hypothetical protein
MMARFNWNRWMTRIVEFHFTDRFFIQNTPYNTVNLKHFYQNQHTKLSSLLVTVPNPPVPSFALSSSQMKLKPSNYMQ